MYTIKVKDDFSSAHNLKGYEGKCENLHGHNWKIEVTVKKQKIDDTGMVLDFKKVKKALSQILEKLDHKTLNDLAYFKKHNPTSENIAKYIYDELSGKIEGLDSVAVSETDSSSAAYFGTR